MIFPASILRILRSAIVLLPLYAGAQNQFLIDSITRVSQTEMTLSYPSAEGYYYILERGNDLENFSDRIGATLGIPGQETLTDPAVPAGDRVFYRVVRYFRTVPGDLDGDGIDDAYELENPTILDPLDGSDADSDPDGDGLTFLEKYLLDTGGSLPQEMFSSPIDGEDGVALTRETVLTFTRPLSAAANIGPGDFFAEFGGLALPGRIDVSVDRRKVSLFYEAPLPASARVRVRVRGFAFLDENNVRFDVDGDGLPGGEKTIDFDTLTLTTLEGTAVCGRVFASNPETGANGTTFVNEPLAGVRITVDGMEEELFAITDAMGNFRLDPAPVGRFFVHIDGRAATNNKPAGSYYPFVGKPWTSRPGEEVKVGNVYLPLIVDKTLTQVSAVAETEIGFPNEVLSDFPEFDGVKLMVPANSLYADDGTRGGMVGIAPVPPDRLPGTLPAGLDLPLVITVQTDGPTNFDQPVPVTFPNLPDPKTGRSLPPGAKTAIWSFNHDSGRWEIAGPATISADGRWAVSDPGTGIRAPGWHGTNPLCRATGGGLTEDRDACATERSLMYSGFVQSSFGLLITPVESIPLLGDAISTGFNFLGAGADCLLNHGDRMACAAGFAQAGHMSLIGFLGGPVGDFASDALLVADASARVIAYENCMNHEEALKVLRSRGATLQKDIIEKSRQMQDLVTGDPVWSNAEPGGLRAREFVWQEIMEAAGDGDLTEDEEREIVDDETRVLPPDLTEEDIEELIDRIQDILENGMAPVEVEQIRTVARELQDTYLQSRADGWRTPFFIRYEFLPQIQREQQQAIANARPIKTRVIYRLINRSTGFIQRGSTSSQGTFDLLVGPDTSFSIDYLNPETGETGRSSFTTGGPGSTISIPPSPLIPVSVYNDTDNDNLNDLAEAIIGTDGQDADTDDDGILDGAEVSQGGNPLGGLQVRTGIISTADTPGLAVDVDARNNVVAVAGAESGVSLFNVFTAMDPTIVAQVGTSVSADAVALTKDYLLVADGTAGAAIFGLQNIPEVTLRHQLNLGEAMSVAATAQTGYVGLANGSLVKIDLPSGAVLDQLFLGAPVHDLALDGDFLYVATPGRIDTISLTAASLSSTDAISVTSGFNTYTGRMRLAVGGGVVYAVHRRGYDTVDVSAPANLRAITTTVTGQFGWKDVALNGSGLIVAAQSPNQSFDGPHNVWLYDASDPALTDVPITSFPTPGVARAVSIFNGIAYVADHDKGLQVINYLSFDAGGLAPTISLTSGAADNKVEERKAIRITADVSDDEQVRNVEFYLNDTLIVTDGNFPFEHRLIAPALADGSTITIKARVSDTGGNSAWSNDLVLTLTPDATPPVTGKISPADGSFIGGLDSLKISFSEALDPATVTTDRITVTKAGNDGLLGTADDLPFTDFTISLSEEGNVLIIDPNGDLDDGLYQVTLSSNLADLRGNPLGTDFTTTFQKGPLISVASSGTPRDPFVASANVGQMITISGAGFDGTSVVTFATVNTNGSVGTRQVSLTNLAPDGRSGNVIIPADAATGDLTLPDGSTKITMQIVPVVTGISGGGSGRTVVVSGTGFIEGRSSVLFGQVAVFDRGPFSNDGIDVYSGTSLNERLGTTVPIGGTLPYVVSTDGGSSGTAGDVTTVIASSNTGTPATPGEASANIGQVVRVEGSGFKPGTLVVTEAIESSGSFSIQTLTPDSIDPGGQFLLFTLSAPSRTGMVSVLGASGGDFLQIVPRVTAISGGRGRFSTISGSGFTEGLVTARFGGVEVVDGGRFSNDGIDVYAGSDLNERIGLTVPIDANLPYQVITEGGSSGRLSDLATMVSRSDTGTPALASMDSANIGQTITFIGSGYLENVTKVTLEAIDSNGTPYITTIDPETVAPDGTSLTFIVPPESRTGIATIMDGGIGELLQIVPRVTAISGGRGRFSTISGTGFTEGFVTAKFGEESVVDGGRFSNDGIDVYSGANLNERIGLTIPLAADLPYQIVTEGGSSGRVSDLSVMTSSSLTGTAADGAQESANVGQAVTLTGSGYSEGITRITLEAMNSGGTPFITTIDPESVSPNGTSLTFIVPPEARTGIAAVLDGGRGKLLQIVPSITAISGGRGRFSTISGSGFIEGFVTVKSGPSEVIDGGPFSNDGIDVYSGAALNERLSLTMPTDAALPYEVITEGGSSGRVTDVSGVNVTLASGIPANPADASANVGQTVTVTGRGFVPGETKITLEALVSDGIPFITTVDPATINQAGTSLTFVIPAAARTGRVTLLSGGSSRLLQIVPTLTSVSSTAPGSFSRLVGTGFTEGQISVNFSGAIVTDGGRFSNDGVDVYSGADFNQRADLTAPAGAASPVTVTTEGGTSTAVTP
jgi:uncharacterized small protein (DUF1192 family)